MLTQTSSEPAALGRVAGRRAAGLGVADVERGGEDVAGEPGGGGLDRATVDVGEVDGQAARRERLRDLQAEAACGAGDEGSGHRPAYA